MRFYFKNNYTFKLQFTEPTNKEIRSAKTSVRFTKANNGLVLNSDRDIDLYYTNENIYELLEREYLYTL